MRDGWRTDRTTTAVIIMAGRIIMEEPTIGDTTTTKDRMIWAEMTEIEMIATATTTMEEQTTTKDRIKMIKEAITTAGMAVEEIIDRKTKSKRLPRKSEAAFLF
jgi:hypothetical protein